MNTNLHQACHDIIYRNMGYTGAESIYLLYDRESPLASTLADAYISVLGDIENNENSSHNISMREFLHPPQPLYRGGMINPDNPHVQSQNRVITSHNIVENTEIGLNHHQIYDVKIATDTSLSVASGLPHTSQGQVSQGQQELHTQEGQKPEQQQSEQQSIDPQIESIKDALISLPVGSIVILVQSTNFRLSTFRIRLELFHRGIHVVEHNHLAYIPYSQYDTFIDALSYRTDEYVRLEKTFRELVQDENKNHNANTRIISKNGDILLFGHLENIRGNTGDYSQSENKGGTLPIGEIFTEAVDLTSVSGRVWIDTFPNEDFSICICEPFVLEIEAGRVLPSPHFPPAFQKLYDWVVQYEGEVMVRELGFGLNPAISTSTPLADINFHERKVGVHLSLGKKHGIFGKKLPKTEVQRFHIDVFVDLDAVYIGDTRVYQDERWIV